VKILITGIAGFGGSGLAESLLKKGHDVTGVDVIAPSEAYRLRGIVDDINYLWKAVQDLTATDLDGYDAVCDFSAQADVPMGYSSPRWTCEQNLPPLVHILEEARNCSIGKFIYPGSGTIFGRPVYLPINEEHPVTPANPYSATKACAEVILWSYHRCYGIPVVGMRNGAVYGPKMRKEIFIYKFLANALKGLPITIEGGDQTRDACYVTDTVDAWSKIIEAPDDLVVGETFQVSAGQEYSVTEIAESCIEATASNSAMEFVDYRPGEKGMRECFDISKARKLLNYEPQVHLKEGLEKTIEWVKQEIGMVEYENIAGNTRISS